MKVITFLNEKGGVGKTTLASILAAGLALDNQRVLVIDADGQADATNAMGLDEQPHFYDFVMRPALPIFNKDMPEASLIRRVPPDTCPAALYVVSGNYETYGIASSSHTKDLAQALVKRLAAVRDVFDVVIVDTQPSPTPLHEAVLMMSDFVIVPTQVENFSTKNLATTVLHIDDARERMMTAGVDKARLLGIVPNMVRERTILHQEFLDGLIEDYGDLVMSPVPLRTNIATAQAIGTFTMHDAPKLETNKSLWAYIDEIVERLATKGVKL